MELNVHRGLPDGLLECPAPALHEHLGGPTLLHLSGVRSPALFVSVLLHGNETSGWDGVRAFLARQRRLPRDLFLFIGNTEAAAEGLRLLPGQPDFNRIWRGASGSGAALAAAVREAIGDESFFAAVDLHNNTGHNPYYSVLTCLDRRNLGLAYLFSDDAVFIEEPDSVLTRVFDDRCPAVTLELGPVGDPRCAERVEGYLDRLFLLDAVPDADPDDLRLFRTRARVHIPEGVDFAFADDPGAANRTLVLTAGVEAVNFHELERGTVFGASDLPVAHVLEVRDNRHQIATESFFDQQDGDIVLRQDVVPAMYTTDPYVIRQDCLCYFMERLIP